MDMGQPHQAPNQQPQYDNAGSQQQAAHSTNRPVNRRWYQPTLESKIVVILVVLASIVVLSSFVAGMFVENENVGDLVKPDQRQAVFLSNDQVYFGDITKISDELLVLEKVYYLQVNRQIQPEQQEAGGEAQQQQQQPQVSLAKLGNELHGPEDQMFISTDKVVFWENLKEDGQVSKAIKQHQKDNSDSAENGNGEAPAGANGALPEGSDQPEDQTESSNGSTPLE